jgi:hypothetical protein
VKPATAPASLTRIRPREEVLHLGGVHIPAGIYQAAGGRLRIESKFGGYKAVVSWTVLVPDPDHVDGHRRVIVPQYFNLDRNKRPKPRGDLARTLIMITGSRRIDRSRLPRAFLGVFARVSVVDVLRDQYHRPLGEAKYSRVDDVVEAIAGRGHGLSLEENRTRLGLRRSCPPLRYLPSEEAK